MSHDPLFGLPFSLYHDNLLESTRGDLVVVEMINLVSDQLWFEATWQRKTYLLKTEAPGFWDKKEEGDTQRNTQTKENKADFGT